MGRIIHVGGDVRRRGLIYFCAIALFSSVFMLTRVLCFSIMAGRSVGEHSSAGRAHALQAWGHRFKPCCSHQCAAARLRRAVSSI